MTFLWLRRFVAQIPTPLVDMIGAGGVGLFVGMGLGNHRCFGWW